MSPTVVVILGLLGSGLVFAGWLVLVSRLAARMERRSGERSIEELDRELAGQYPPPL